MYNKIELSEKAHIELVEIAKELGKPKSEVVVALEAIVEPVSFYEPVYSNGGDTIYLMDQLGSVESDGDWIDEIAMKEAIKNLPQREKKILLRIVPKEAFFLCFCFFMRFMKGMTQTEVAEEIGISQAQVSRLEKSAIEYVKGEK